MSNQGSWNALKLSQFAAPGLIVLGVLVFYWRPLTSGNTTAFGYTIAAGEHDVEFRFRSRSFIAGAMISITAALILLSQVIGNQVYGYLDRVLFRPTAYRRKRRTQAKIRSASA